jgi:alpha-2-macroglobulin
MGFSTDRSDALWWLMVSVDTNAVRLLLSELSSPEWKADIPRLVRGALGRQHHGHWDTTVANAWGKLAMEKFSKLFENVPVTGQSKAQLASQTQTVDWKAAPKGSSLSFTWPQARSALDLSMNGTGKPWVTIQSLAAIPLKEPLSNGFRIKRTLTPIEQKVKGVWTAGDIVRVKLEVESQSDMTWVVINDPVPAGSAILGTGLGRDSTIMTKGEATKGWVWPAFEERSFEGYRAYYEYVAKGSWSTEYTLRLNNRGLFQLPPTRVEAMYAPEMFGELPVPAFEVK